MKRENETNEWLGRPRGKNKIQCIQYSGTSANNVSCGFSNNISYICRTVNSHEVLGQQQKHINTKRISLLRSWFGMKKGVTYGDRLSHSEHSPPSKSNSTLQELNPLYIYTIRIDWHTQACDQSFKSRRVRFGSLRFWVRFFRILGVLAKTLRGCVRTACICKVEPKQ